MFEFRFIKSGLGEIQIEEFVESFHSDHSYWSMDQYIAQWEAAKKLAIAGTPSLFITSITKPSSTNFIRCWVCYPVGTELIFREQILFLDQLSEPFNEGNPHVHIEPYECEDDEPVSEWRIAISSVTDR